MFRFTQACGLILAAVAFVGCDSKPAGTASSSTTQPSGGGGGAKRIAVIPKGTSHEYWKSVQRGAEAAATERGATIVWKGPVQESDRATQVQIVEQFATEGVDAIVLAPLDRAALVRPVAQATAKGIPVVIIDSALDGTPGKDFASFVATDNKEGGRTAGRELVKQLGAKGGKVILLRYSEGHASTGDRETGFLEVVKAAPNVTILADNRYAGATASEAQTTALNMIDQIKECDAIFAPNESSTFGLLQAMRQSGLAGKKIFVGFDATGALLEALKKGEINALVAQNPVKMGRVGVELALDKIAGKTVEANVDSGAALITKENLDSPEVKTILGGN